MYTMAEKEAFTKLAAEAVSHEHSMQMYDKLMSIIADAGAPREVIFMLGVAIGGYAVAVAQVARAQALGIDPDDVVFSDEELKEMAPRAMEKMKRDIADAIFNDIINGNFS